MVINKNYRRLYQIEDEFTPKPKLISVDVAQFPEKQMDETMHSPIEKEFIDKTLQRSESVGKRELK